MAGPIYQLSVLANGNILLNGKPATQADIAAALDGGARDSVVWYYRENAAGEPPASALEVLKIVTDRRLPVRLFTKPDFSDVQPPQAAGEWAKVFEAARKRAAQGQLVVVRPDGRLLSFPAVPREGLGKQILEEVERILSPAAKRNVAILADTAWAMTAQPTLPSASAAIPFLGLVIGLVTIGHAVWVFDAPGAAVLGSACTDADLLIADEGRLSLLPPDWNAIALPAMRLPKMYSYQREGRRLVPLRAGASDVERPSAP